MSWKEKIMNDIPREGDIYKINPNSYKGDWSSIIVPPNSQRFTLSINEESEYQYEFDNWSMSLGFLKEHFIKVKK